MSSNHLKKKQLVLCIYIRQSLYMYSVNESSNPFWREIATRKPETFYCPLICILYKFTLECLCTCVTSANIFVLRNVRELPFVTFLVWKLSLQRALNYVFNLRFSSRESAGWGGCDAMCCGQGYRSFAKNCSAV